MPRKLRHDLLSDAEKGARSVPKIRKAVIRGEGDVGKRRGIECEGRSILVECGMSRLALFINVGFIG